MPDMDDFAREEMTADEVETIFTSFLRNARKMRASAADLANALSDAPGRDPKIESQDTFEREFEKAFTR